MQLPSFRSLVSFRGRMSRQDFWIYYLGYVLLTTLATLGWSFLATLVARAGLDFLLFATNVLMVALLCTLTAGFVGAMMRRVRDSGKRVWVVLVFFSVLIATIISVTLDGMNIEVHMAAGDLAEWRESRLPITECLAVVALLSGYATFRGLVRRSAPITEETPSSEFPPDAE